MLVVVGVKVCKSTYLFKVPETPNFISSQLGHLMEMAQRKRGESTFFRVLLSVRPAARTWSAFFLLMVSLFPVFSVRLVAAQVIVQFPRCKI